MHICYYTDPRFWKALALWPILTIYCFKQSAQKLCLQQKMPSTHFMLENLCFHFTENLCSLVLLLLVYPLDYDEMRTLPSAILVLAP